MTPRKKWHVADDDRDDAAEFINTAAMHLEAIADKMPADLAAKINKETIRLQKSLRLLEKNGAQTRVSQERLMAPAF